MRLIDADEAVKRIAEEQDKATTGTEDVTYYRAIKIIREQPTIEAKPVKWGQWIHHAGMNSKCSCCGRYFPVAEFEQRPFDVNFCIHCGAKMKGSDTKA